MDYLKELKIQYVETNVKNPLKGQVEKPADVYKLFKDMENSDKEKIVGVYLTSRMAINSFEIVSIGAIERSFIMPKEIFKGALLTNSPRFIVLHNHPSGDPEPGKEDIKLIRKIEQQSEIMDIMMIDFIVVGHQNFWSWKAQEYLTA